MKKYSGVRPLTEIKAIADTDGWEIDSEDFDEGGDFIWIRDVCVRFKQVLFNTVNGWFWIYSPESEDAIVTHLSTEFDGVDWYEEILNLVYLPVE